MIMRKQLLLLLCILITVIQSFAQSKTVTGKVTNENGENVAGASVVVTGRAIGTITDAAGRFTISVPANAKSLDFSAVNFSSKTVAIPVSNQVAVTLQLSNASLSEVIVVGYGTQRRKEVTGSMATVVGAVVADKPVQSFEQALAGRAAGVQITVPSGVLNAPPVFRIRGTNSISLSSQPLIVIDGIASLTGDYSSTNSASNALASINPNDIESIDIAKDAAATAIYGSRAANGVVFVTTKKGKQGKTRVAYNGSVGWTKTYRLPKLLDAFQYTDYKNSAIANNPTQPSTLKFNLTNGPDGQPINTNWYDYVYQTGFQQNHNVNVSGGNDNTTYYFSVGYTDQQGVIRKNAFQRKNALFNIDSRVNKVVTIGGKISYSNEANLAATTSGSLSGEAFSTGGLGRTAMVNAPNVSPYNNDGSYNIGTQYIGSMNNAIPQVGFNNPVPVLDLNRSNSFIDHIQSNAYLQIKPLSWVTLRSVYGIDYLLADNDLFWNPIHGDGQSYGGYALDNFAKYKRWVWTNTVQFDHTFGGRHSTSLLIGNEQQRGTSSGYGINRQTLTDPAYTVIQAGFTTNNSSNQILGENYLLSSFARLNYDFSKKYFISGNVRQDENSVLGKKKGVFWGVSGGWEITKENFWETTGLNRIFSSFKVRGSYGRVGNSNGILDFASFSTFGSTLTLPGQANSLALYGGNPILLYNQAGNPDLTWETSSKTDAGFSFGILNNRVSGEFAYYRNNIDNLILNVPQSPSAGLPTSVPANVGTMYNKGIELTLSATPIQTKQFSWTSSFNITYNKNQVTSLAPGLTEILSATSSLESVNKTKTDYSLGELFVVRTGGVDPATGRRIFINSQGNQVLYQYYVPTGQNMWSNPDGTKYVSPTGGTAITQAADGVMYANVLPKQYGGWDNTFRFGDFDLNVLMTYQLGFYVYYGSNAGLHDQRFWNNSVDVLNRWQKAGDVTNIPKAVYLDNTSNGSAIPLDINVFKGDFVKLRNLSLGYNLPKLFLSKLSLSNARIYVSGQNLAIITKYPGPDPEVSSNGTGTINQGVDRNTIGNARTMTIGLNVSF